MACQALEPSASQMWRRTSTARGGVRLAVGFSVSSCPLLSCRLAEPSLSSRLQMMVVDGASGAIVWSYSIPCNMKETPTTSAITSDQKSVFLFWAEALTGASLSSVSVCVCGGGMEG